MKNDSVKRSDGRIFLVYALLLLFGVVCIVTILLSGTRDRAFYTGKDSKRCKDLTKENQTAIDPDCNCTIRLNTNVPRRGDIYDDQGRVIASDIIIYDITLDGSTLHRKKKDLVKNSAKLDSIINQLADDFYTIFNKKFPHSKDYYKQRIEYCYKEGKNKLIIRSIETDEKRWVLEKDIEKLKLNQFFQECKNDKYTTGLNLTRRTVRLNPYGDLARRTIGRQINGRWDGLEFDFNKSLHGVDGAKEIITINHIEIPLNDELLPQDGANLHTTINLEIQNIVHKELLRTLRQYRAKWGCAVVMETKTGEIKAISNLTAVDSLIFTEQNNYAIHGLEEPGSTFKLASILAYLEKTKNDSAKQYPVYAHEFIYKTPSGKVVKYKKDDGLRKGKEMAYPIRVFQQSSNVGIASMILDVYGNSHIGFQDYLKMIDKMSITTAFNTQLGTIKAPVIRRTKTDFHNYYAACFGANFKIAPIQTLVYFNAVANNGKMVAPLFVKSISKDQKTIETFTAEVLNEQICSPATITRAQEYLLSVVNGSHGTAKKYKNKFSFAGKTGTRDVYDEATGKYLTNRNSASFCGYFPAEDPKYTCIVFIYNVREKSYIALDAFVRIAEKTLNVFNYEALPEIDKSKGKLPFTFHIASSENAKTVLQSMGYETDLKELKAPYIYAQKGTFYTLVPNEKGMPDVRGMNAADAIFILNNAGYKVNITGRGTVRKQERIPNSKVIELTLTI